MILRYNNNKYVFFNGLQRNFHDLIEAGYQIAVQAYSAPTLSYILKNVETVNPEFQNPPSVDSREFHQGVEMTLPQLQELLRQHGIETEDVVGQPSGPHLHEAVSPGDDPTRPDHAIIEVFQRGYRRSSKIVRPARVLVNDLTHSHPAQHVR